MKRKAKLYLKFYALQLMGLIFLFKFFHPLQQFGIIGVTISWVLFVCIFGPALKYGIEIGKLRHSGKNE